MVVHFILDMLIYVLLCIVYSFCPLEEFVRVASKTRDLMLWCAALSAEKDGCAGSLYGVLGMRERLIIYRNLWLYTHVGVPILVFIAFIKFWRTLDLYFPTVDLICPLLFCLQNYLHGDALLHEVLGICIFSNKVSDLLILNEFDFKQAKMGREYHHGNI